MDWVEVLSPVFEELIENFPVGVLIVTLEGDILKANRIVLEFTGYTEEEIKGLNVTKLYKNPADRELFLRGLLEKGMVRDFEAEFLSKDGRPFWALLDSRLVSVGDKRLIITVARDITQQKKAEEKLRRILEDLPVGVLITAKDGKVLYANPFLAELLGGDIKRLENLRVTQLYGSKKDRKRFTKELLEKGEVRNFELRLKDEGERWVSVNATLEKIGDEELIITTVEDITQRKLFQKELLRLVEERTRELAESESRYRQMVENPLVGVYLADERGVFLFINRRLSEMSGYEPEEVIGKKTMLEVIAPEYREWLARRLMERKAGRLGPDVVEAELLKKDGTRFWALTAAAEYRDAEGNIKGYLGVVVDITEKKVAERRVLELLEDLRSFSHSISHDLKAPLRALQSYAEAVLEDYGEDLPEGALELVQRISGTAQKMAKLIEDILTYTRITGSKPELKRIELKEVLSEILSYFGEEIRSSGAKVEVKEPLPPVLADETLLRLVLLNLISNALKYRHPERRPEIEVKAESNDWVTFWIKDNGIGIDGEFQERIFRMFERLHGEESYPGTGAGLAIAKRAAERMGGSIGVASEPGKGSSFWIKLRRGEGNIEGGSG
ncbi:PAS domain S-box-containing protein [Hydrogenivirga caldilitoris]|uniref:histidine kinase n=1 Tax=Hydrogenivirga caldilitoris TaxID=246264 RepID=A0A497XP48_9AQUI|nr:PAS domain S-box protein [Hydrogenivirga caldilitoris]RLJ70727.1 PAS domain S-box-containing protein [Hydrogenivirga caldilitoris]